MEEIKAAPKEASPDGYAPVVGRSLADVEKLRELKEGRPVETEIVLPVSLVVRNSTAPRRG